MSEEKLHGKDCRKARRSALCVLGPAALHRSPWNSPGAMAQARLMQTAFYLAAFAAAAIIFAITLNWRNDRFGFLVNAVIVGIADIPFILFVLVPGYVPWWPGLLGPLLWIAAFFFTALARMGSTPPAAVGSGSVAHLT